MQLQLNRTRKTPVFSNNKKDIIKFSSHCENRRRNNLRGTEDTWGFRFGKKIAHVACMLVRGQIVEG